MFIVKEAKQVGLLSHATFFSHFEKILADDTLCDMVGDGISFSRDLRLTSIAGFEYGSQERGVQFILDGNKLSNRYKFVPYADLDHTHRGVGNTESEERMEPDKDIVGLGKYIVEIRLLKKNKLRGLSASAVKVFFDYLRKYPHIKTDFLKHFPDKVLEKYLSGVYKQGEWVKPFTLKTSGKVLWSFLKLVKDLKNVSDLKQIELEQGILQAARNLATLPTEQQLKGFDLIWVESRKLFIRAKNYNPYLFFDNYGLSTVKIPYKGI